MKSISKKWLIAVAVLLVGLFAVGVPVLASAGNNDPGQVPVVGNNAYGVNCMDSGTLARLATALGMTPADLTVQLQSSKTLAAIAGEKNVPTSALVEAIIAPYAARIAQQFQNGYLTQTQAQTYLDAARQAATNLLALNLATVGGFNNWSGFCGNYLNAGAGLGAIGPGMMGGYGNLFQPVTVPATPGSATPGIGWGMMGGGFGCR